MKTFRPAPYPNPIDVDRHPELAGLDNDLRREALGLPVKRSVEDQQFLNEAEAYLQKKESDRILAELQKKKRPTSFNSYLHALRSERKQYEEEVEDCEAYEAEQRRNEQKWLQRRNMQYKSGARFSQDTTSTLQQHVDDIHDAAKGIMTSGRFLRQKASDLQELWQSEGQGSAYGN